LAVNLNIAYHPNQEKFLFTKRSPKVKKKIIRKGRRFGGTKGLANFVSESILDGSKKKILWGDVTLGNIRKYWSRYFYPIWKDVPRNLWSYSKQDNTFKYRDTYIDFRGADHPEGWEGFGYDLIILNEAGIILKNEDLWYNSVLPMSLEYDADMFILGTPKGKRGVYYELDQECDTNEEYERFVFTSYDNPLIPADRIKKMEASMPEIVARQEIYAEFIDDKGSVFNNVDECAVMSQAAPEPGRSYYMGLDLAKTSDFTVIKVMTEEGVEVYTDRFNQLDWAIQKEKIKGVAELYNDASILVDATGLGDVILEDLELMGLNVEGLKFSNESKFQLIKALILAFEKKTVSIIDDSVTKSELKNFEYSITSTGKIKYEARKGHDDTVAALALAYFQVKDGAIPTIRHIPPPTAMPVGNINVYGGKWTKV